MAGYLESMQKFFQTNNKTKEYQVHSSKVHSVAWNCDGKRLASGSFDKTVVTFVFDRGDRLSKDNTFRGHTDSVDQLCWHPSNSDLLVTASGDKTVRLWDARSRKPVATVATKGENINVCWSPDGHTVAVGNKEDLVTFIDMRTHKSRTEEQFKFEVNEISWNNDGDLFFLTSGQGSIHLLRLQGFAVGSRRDSPAVAYQCYLQHGGWKTYPDLKSQYVLSAHPANCICIEFDPTGRYFATGSADALVSLWDVCELVCLRTLARLDWPVRTLSFSYDGRMLASASEDLVIDIADVETGEKIADVSCESPTFTVAWHPKRHLLAFACDDKDKYDRERDSGTVKLFGVTDSRDT